MLLEPICEPKMKKKKNNQCDQECFQIFVFLQIIDTLFSESLPQLILRKAKFQKYHTKFEKHQTYLLAVKH